MSEKILVTGAAGFIGFSLCRELFSKDIDILAVDNFNDYYDPNLKEARYNILIQESQKRNNGASFSFERLDLQNRDKTFSLLSTFKPTTICHLAAQAGVRYSLDNPYSYVDNNITVTLNLLEISKEIGVTDFIMASTSSVYGLNQSTPFSENTKIDSTISPYASTKQACELLCHSYHYLYKIRFRILRFFTVYGPWGRPDMALFIFTKSIIEGKPIKVFNSGNMKRDFTFVKDIVSGFSLAINNKFEFEIFNLGFGQTVNLMDFINNLEQKLNIEAKKEYLPLQAGDVPETWSDISKARQMLGYNPKYSVNEGISEFVQWYRNHYKI